MALDKEEIEKIARLAHLRVTEAEIKEMGEDLSSILSYVDKLSQADTEGIEPLAHVTGVENIMREDEVRACEDTTRDAIVEAFPESQDDQLKVKPVFE